ncbi:alpha/beta hydrolase [Anaeromyxobacter sp. SG26]|uniref:alpha/beta hydrolase n=1 Tax=Anaeromyxobacter sp. SG26 TaxID=2925407 RepID=UPI001F594597|nr:alpha/beta family hydrolase [Anaeromyxobacter sp. SG26]
MQVDIPGPAGRLEALVEEPLGLPAGGAPRFAAMVCHPHPRFGGTLHTHAAHRLAKAVRAAGGVALRFNFRGVGRSAGAYDRGRGEADDARAALAWLARERPELPRLAGGFSFGAWMAVLAGGADASVRGLLLAGLALRSADVDLVRDTALVTSVEKPVAIVQAANDEFGTPDEVRLALAGSRGPRRIAAVPNTTHLFTEDLAALQREAEVAIAWLMEDARR